MQGCGIFYLVQNFKSSQNLLDSSAAPWYNNVKDIIYDTTGGLICMCTAATYQTKDFYFGRNLDYDSVTARPSPLPRGTIRSS